MTFLANKQTYEIATYRQQGGYDCKIWDWAVFMPDGVKQILSGTTQGLERDAKREAREALDKYLLRQKTKQN